MTRRPAAGTIEADDPLPLADNAAEAAFPGKIDQASGSI